MMRQSDGRLRGVDLARALAMLGMLVEHSVQYPKLQPKSILWSVYGRSGPLFVLVAGIGLSLAARGPRRPLGRTMILARVPLLLLVGMALSLGGEGVILQSFALFFVVGVGFVRRPRWVLATAAGGFLVVGPLFLTVLRRHAVIHFFGSPTDVGFHGLVDPVAFLLGLSVSYYPAVIWLGFFLVGMLLGRGDVSSAVAGRRLFGWAAAAAGVLLTAGWAGARAFAPAADFSVAPPPPTMWSQHWTTYGFSNSVGWAVSSTALALAVVGASIWLVAAVRRPARMLAPFIALGAMPLTFYILHFLYLGTLWEQIQPRLTNPLSYLVASAAFWLLFAAVAQRWLAHFRRGPFESVLHAGALALVLPLRLRPPTVSGDAPRLEAQVRDRRVHDHLLGDDLEPVAAHRVDGRARDDEGEVRGQQTEEHDVGADPGSRRVVANLHDDQACDEDEQERERRADERKVQGELPVPRRDADAHEPEPGQDRGPVRDRRGSGGVVADRP
jgi:hypothetical protein